LMCASSNNERGGADSTNAPPAEKPPGKSGTHARGAAKSRIPSILEFPEVANAFQILSALLFYSCIMSIGPEPRAHLAFLIALPAAFLLIIFLMDRFSAPFPDHVVLKVLATAVLCAAYLALLGTQVLAVMQLYAALNPKLTIPGSDRIIQLIVSVVITWSNLASYLTLREMK
jgi:hypothetical protein